MKAYRVDFPGNPDLDFRIGQKTPCYGEVLEIKETTETSKYVDGVPLEETCIVVIRFPNHEIKFNASNPLMCIYRTNIEEK